MPPPLSQYKILDPVWLVFFWPRQSQMELSQAKVSQAKVSNSVQTGFKPEHAVLLYLVKHCGPYNNGIQRLLLY